MQVEDSHLEERWCKLLKERHAAQCTVYLTGLALLFDTAVSEESVSLHNGSCWSYSIPRAVHPYTQCVTVKKRLSPWKTITNCHPVCSLVESGPLLLI